MSEKYQKLKTLIGNLSRHTCVHLANQQLDALLDFTSYKEISNYGSSNEHMCQSHACQSHVCSSYLGHTETASTGTGDASRSCIPVFMPQNAECGYSTTCPLCLSLLHLTSLNLILRHHLLTYTHIHGRPGIIHFLVECVYCNNRYVSYLGSRVLTCLLKEHIVQLQEVKACFQHLLQTLSKIYRSVDKLEPETNQLEADEQNQGMFSNVMNVFKEALCVHSEEASVALDVIHIEWGNLEPLFQSALSSDKCCVSVNSFLSLLKTLVKVHTEKGWIISAVTLLVPGLFNSLRKDSIPDYLKINALQLFHQLLCHEKTLDNKEKTVCDQIIKWIMSGGLDSISSMEEDIGGFGWRLSPQEKKNSDNLQLKQTACLLSLKSVSEWISKKQNCDKNDVSDDALTLLDIILNNFGRHIDSKWLETLFMNQDDMWISGLISILNIYKHLTHSTTNERIVATKSSFNIHHCVSDFLSVILFDHTVLIDFLSSPETQFLLLVLLYLKLIRHNWKDFCQALDELDCLVMRSNSHVKSLCIPCQMSKFTSEPFIVDPTGSKHPSAEPCLKTTDSSRGHLVNNVTNPVPILPGSLQSLSVYDSSDSEEDVESTCNEALELPLSADCVVSVEMSNLDNTCEMTEKSKYLHKAFGKQKLTKEQEVSEDRDKEVNISHLSHTCGVLEDTSSTKLNTSGESLTPKFPIGDMQTGELRSERLDNNDSTLDKVMSVFIRLRLGLEHLTESGLFLYDIKPLLSVLEDCEMLYEVP